LNTVQPSLVLGYHGTDTATVKKIIEQKSKLNPSENTYDWLGHGVYFWENDPLRAIEFAEENFKRKKIKKKIGVIGAIIDLGFCLNLLERSYVDELKASYKFLANIHNKFGTEIPQNSDPLHLDLIPLQRNLDCAVIQNLHTMRLESGLKKYDTVRSVFTEGEEIYHNAGFRDKNHIQICVRNTECIKGYFYPKEI